ncbi:MAG: DUF748 domain-containing protein [Candidatus Omnitrophota bacterium]
MFWKKFFILAGLLVIVIFIAQLMVAPYAKRLIIEAAKENLGADISIGNCALSLLNRRIILEDLIIPNPDNKNDYLVKAKELSADFYLFPLLFNKQALRFVSLTDAEIILCRDKSGALKLPQFKLPEVSKPEKKPKPAILFGKLSINNGNVKFIDQYVSSPSTITTFSDINCVISNSFSLFERRVMTDLTAKGKIEEQGSFSLNAKGDFISKPASFKGDLIIKNVSLPKFSPYYGKNLSIEVKSGDANIDAAALCDKGQLNVKGNAQIDNIYLEPIGNPSQSILFELKTSDVIDLLKNENNSVIFSFEVAGDLHNPSFSWGQEVLRAVKKSMFRAITEGVGRLLLRAPASAGEKIGNIIGGEAGEKIKGIGRELQKILGR